MIRVVDYKAVDMTDEEFEYYNKLTQELTFGTYNAKEQFHDMFDVDENGYISMIRPPMKKEVYWAVIVFLQNLMLNQHIRKMENWIKEFINGKSSNNS